MKNLYSSGFNLKDRIAVINDFHDGLWLPYGIFF